MDKIFDTPGAVALSIDIPAGDVSLVAEQTVETRVELEPLDDAAREAIGHARIELRERSDGHTLSIAVPERRGFFGRNPHFVLRVRCPEGTDVDARTRSADLALRGAFGSVIGKTASGDVAVDKARGEVEIHTASGDVEVGSGAAGVAATTASGDVTVHSAVGPIRVQVVSGDVTIGEALEAVDVNSVSGDLQLDAVGPGSVRAKSVSGDVRIAVRRGLDVWMDVSSLSGDTSCELASTDGPADEGVPLVEVRAKTVSGDVTIARATAVAPSSTA